MADDIKALKLKRRGAKARLTRYSNAWQILIDEGRCKEEVLDSFAKVQQAYSDVQEAHENYTINLEDDQEFEQEEEWMEDCQKNFIKLKINMLDYAPSKEAAKQTVTSEDQHDFQAIYMDQDIAEDSPAEPSPLSSVRKEPSSFKIERPKLPKFTGDVREYCIFKSDFIHLIDSRYGKRDAITILRSCLQGRPLELIRGIGSDYDAAWEHLDSIYGDPRFVADAIISDLNKFRPLKDNEDGRFCELVHLVRRSYNTLKEIGRTNDMDNSNMLAMIEKKMNIDDRKVWFRSQESSKDPASLHMLLNWMSGEMKTRMRATAPLRSDSRHATVGLVSQPSTGSQFQQRPQYRCWICKTSDHWVDQCKKLIGKTAPERLKFIKDNHACFSCLKRSSRSHNMATCRRRRQCSEKKNGERCSYFHHPLLHFEETHTSNTSNTAEASSSGRVGVASVSSNEALLPLLTVEALGQETVKRGNVLLDSGAQISLVKEEFASELQLKGVPTTITVTKIGGEEEVLQTHRYRVPIREVDSGGKPIIIHAVGIPCISENVSAVNLDDLARKLNIRQESLHRGNGSVDLLIGVDHARLHNGEIREAGHCTARRSPVGWVLFGTTLKDAVHTHTVLHVKLTGPVDLTDFWTVEADGLKSEFCHCQRSSLTHQEAVEEELIRSSARKVGKQWEIAYPWSKDPDLLPDNKIQAEKILSSTEKRLAKNPKHAEAYDKQIKEMEEMGFSRKLTADEINKYQGPVHYISHHAVVRPEKKSTPIRIVFNSSATFKGHCLNDYWHKGPDLLNNLFGVLLRFREHEVALCADISKMYHRVLIPMRDQHVHRFLWRNMDQQREPDIYMMKVVTFGDKPASAIAQTALRLSAEEGESTHPEAATTLKKNVYMDDICDSVKSEKEAKKLSMEIDELLDQGGFKVKGWLSNNPLDGDTSEERGNLLEKIAEEKVLGVVWEIERDVFSYKVKMDERLTKDDKSMPDLTKRKILGQIAHIFDPIGFAAPIIVRAKIGMQILWQRGYEWDEPLPETDQASWRELFEEMKKLNDVTLKRCLTPPSVEGKPTLCIFSDASENAYGTCAYLRWQTENDGYEVRFVAGKSKVAPLKTLTIPRLELQAAVLAARMYKAISDEMRLQVEKVVFFTDSMIALQWIKTPARTFKPFVSSRVAEIQTLTNTTQWKHIPGEKNVADKVSRGIAVEKLTDEWKNGPEFLHDAEEGWPVDQTKTDQKALEEEKRKVQSVLTVTETDELIDCTKFSSWKKLQRVTAYVFRAIQIMKSKIQKGSPPDDEMSLSPTDLERAEKYWILTAQKSLIPRFEKGEFKVLSPFLDNEGVIRVGGRLENLVSSYDSKHPAILPANHYISLLITRYMHELGHHGVSTTTAKTRRKYWILQVHRLAKTVKYRCVTCRAAEHKRETQMMANLPSSRVAPYTPPFHFTSCDYFGPYHVKVGRNKRAKYYGVIFTCLNTRAVHLELATDCSTMEFLQVLRRFFAVRGQPAQILSDNGTQFVGAQRELREMVRGWSERELKDFCAEKGVQWKFVTPGAPHQNGCAEALVKSCKYALKKAIGEQELTPFELYTCLLEIANLVNERPIGRVVNDPDEGAYHANTVRTIFFLPFRTGFLRRTYENPAFVDRS